MSTRPLEIPAPRPPATGELVDIRAWPAYREKHGLVVERVAWPPHSPYPVVTVRSLRQPQADGAGDPPQPVEQ